MNFRRIRGLVTGLFGGATAGSVAIGEVAQAQQDLGDSIANSVSGAVSSIATNSGGTASGGTSVERSEVSLGEQQGLAISDASGGSNNVSLGDASGGNNVSFES
jgi:hypothetical protein